MPLHRSHLLLMLAWLLLSGIASPLGADDSEKKIRDAGFGISFSNGQSLFYSRATNPFRSNHTYFAVGFHQEGEGFSLDPYDPYRNRFASVRYYLELGLGWRHLLFRESLAGGFFPHTVIEGGASGYLSQTGSLSKYFRETSFRWAPYLQAGLGASIYTGVAIYRIEMGYLTTLSYYPEDYFPVYQGVFLKVVYSSGVKPR